MEKRRIQCTGGSSYSITLPKDWIQAHHIKEQDAVTVLPRKSGSLIIQPPTPGGRAGRRKLVVDGRNEEELQREIIALYIHGAEEIEIVGTAISKKERLAVRKASELLMGMETIEEASKGMLLKNMLSPDKFSFQQGIEKMFSMATAMVQDAIAAFSTADRSLAQDVMERDFEIDKIYFLILRQNHSIIQEQVSEQQIGFSLGMAKYYERIATQLERIGDHAVKISQVVIENDPTSNAKFNRLLQSAIRRIMPLLREASSFTRKIDRALAHRLLNAIEKTSADVVAMRKEIIKSGFTEAVIVSDSIDRLRGYIANMAEVTIDQSFSEE